MTDHAIVAREPVIQKSKWIYQNGELQQVFRKDKDHPDLPDLYSYECNCGKTFDSWEKATDHLEEA